MADVWRKRPSNCVQISKYFTQRGTRATPWFITACLIRASILSQSHLPLTSSARRYAKCCPELLAFEARRPDWRPEVRIETESFERQRPPAPATQLRIQPDAVGANATPVRHVGLGGSGIEAASSRQGGHDRHLRRFKGDDLF